MKKISALLLTICVMFSFCVNSFATPALKVSEENKVSPVIKAEYIETISGMYKYEVTYNVDDTFIEPVADPIFGTYSGKGIQSFEIRFNVDTNKWSQAVVNKNGFTKSSLATGAYNSSNGYTTFNFNASGADSFVTTTSGHLFYLFLKPVNETISTNEIEFGDVMVVIEKYVDGTKTESTEYSTYSSADYSITTQAGEPVVKDEFENVTSDQSVNNTAEGSDGKFNGKYLKYVANVFEGADATKKIRITKNKGATDEETMETQRSIAEVLKGVAVDASNKISGDVAIGVLTDSETDVFTFDLF